MSEPVKTAVRAEIEPTPLEMSAIVREHYEVVYRFCARRVGQDWAADVAQETFLNAQKALKRFRFESSLRSWLIGIALNECRSLIRKRKLFPPTIEFDLPDASASGRENAWIDRTALTKALNALSDEHRDVVVMHEIEGLSYDEIAAVIGIPSGTVKSRLHHAFINLRKSLRDEVRG